MRNNRVENLKYLHNISPAVELVVLPSEGAIECTYVSKNGYSYEWRGINDWPALSISGFNKNDINKLKESICFSDLAISDVERLTLGRIYNAFAIEAKKDKPIKEVFADAMVVDDSNNYVLYALNITDCDDPKIVLFTSYKEFEIKFYERYFSIANKWDELSDDDLSEWKQRIEDEIDGIPSLTLEKDVDVNG